MRNGLHCLFKCQRRSLFPEFIHRNVFRLNIIVGLRRGSYKCANCDESWMNHARALRRNFVVFVPTLIYLTTEILIMFGFDFFLLALSDGICMFVWRTHLLNWINADLLMTFYNKFDVVNFNTSLAGVFKVSCGML